MIRNSKPTSKNVSKGLIDGYDQENYDSDFPMGVSGAARRYLGQSFSCGQEQYFKKAIFYIKDILGVSINITAQLYNLEGTFGTNSKPTGDPIAVSNTIQSILFTDYTNVEFVFPLTLLSAGNYGIAIHTTLLVDPGLIHVKFKTIGTHSGNLFSGNDGTSWSTNSSQDLCFAIPQLKPYSVNLSKH